MGQPERFISQRILNLHLLYFQPWNLMQTLHCIVPFLQIIEIYFELFSARLSSNIDENIQDY